MKRLRKFTLLCVLLASAAMAKAGDTYKVTFALADFQIVTEGGITSIRPADEDMFLMDDASLPALPYKTVNILRPQASKTLYDISFSKTLVATGVTMEANPKLYPTSMMPQVVDTLPGVAGMSVDTPAMFAGDHIMTGYSFCSFNVTPFLYDAETKELFFVPEVTLTLEEKAAEAATRARALGNGATTTLKVKTEMEDYIKGMVINPDEMADKYNAASTSTEANARRSVKYNRAASAGTAAEESEQRDVDYLVVTSKALTEAFKPFVEWKRRKGVWAEIVTVEDIDSTYEGDLQLKIKQCLYDYYQNLNLKWVLLGGDVGIVPEQRCPLTYMTYRDTCPVDLFYACFDEPFDWDLDGNGLRGEKADNVDLYPEVYISRWPVNDTTDVSNIVNKIIKYESSPNEDYLNKMLLSGWRSYVYLDDAKTKSDSHGKSQHMRDKYIKPYWDGEISELFDTGSTFEDDRRLSRVNLTNEIDSGYHFMHMMTHGLETLWQVNTTNPVYYTADWAKVQKNVDATIIVTTACLTNAFDSGTSLSEAFMRNKNACLAYIGNSRYGWTTTSKDSSSLGMGALYNAAFFKYMFTIESGNIGEAFALAKQQYAPNSTGNTIYRWIQFSLNMLADPEMQVFTKDVQHFEKPSVTASGRSVTVSTGGVDSCTITLMSKADGGLTYYKTVDGVSSYTFNGVNAPFSVTIIKRNYIPYLYDHDDDTFGEGEDIVNASVEDGYYVIHATSVDGSAEGYVRYDGGISESGNYRLGAGLTAEDAMQDKDCVWKLVNAGNGTFTLCNEANGAYFIADPEPGQDFTGSSDTADLQAVFYGDHMYLAMTNYVYATDTAGSGSYAPAYLCAAFPDDAAEYGPCLAWWPSIGDSAHLRLEFTKIEGSVDPGKLYRLRNEGVQEYMSGGGLAKGYASGAVAGNVGTTGGDTGLGDIWQFEDAGDSTYRLLNLNAGTYLAAGTENATTTARLDSAGTFGVMFSGGEDCVLRLAAAADGPAYLQALRESDGEALVNLSATSGVNTTWTLEEVDGVEVSITAAGWTALCLPFAVTPDDGLTAYTGSTVTGNTIVLVEITGSIPAGTPVLLHADEAGTYRLAVDYGNTDDAPTGNTLLGTTVRLEGVPATTFYDLMDGPDGVGFYCTGSTGDNDTATIPANEAYLGRDAEASTEYVRFAFGDGMPTGIGEATDGTAGEAVYYDLQGRRVLYPSRGIYVTDDGQKVFVK